MNIIILRTNTSDFGKIGSYNVQEVGLANALINKGHNVTVLYLNRDTKKIITDEKYSNVKYFPHLTFGLHGIFKTSLLKQFHPQLVILFSDNQLWAKNVIYWCNKNNVTCMQYFGAVLSDNPRWLHQFYTKMILKRNIASYHRCINISKTNKVKEEMQRLGIPCQRVISIGLDETLLQNCTNSSLEIRTEFGYDKDDKVILFVGRLSPEKRPINACKILLELLSKDQTYKLVIIGKGIMQAELLTFIQDHNLQDKVTYIEQVPYNQMYKYFVSSDCLINLSNVEIFGMTILEAMYYGLPVVAHVAPGPSDVIKNLENGFLCDSNEASSYIPLIEKAIEEHIKISANARKYIKENYMWNSIADEFLDCYINNQR